jgi:hypothetical protein
VAKAQNSELARSADRLSDLDKPLGQWHVKEGLLHCRVGEYEPLLPETGAQHALHEKERPACANFRAGGSNGCDGLSLRVTCFIYPSDSRLRVLVRFRCRCNANQIAGAMYFVASQVSESDFPKQNHFKDSKVL